MDFPTNSFGSEEETDDPRGGERGEDMMLIMLSCEGEA